MLKPKRSVLLIFLGPAVLFYLLVFLYPTIRTTLMSFFRVVSVSDAVSKWSFYGIENYKYIFLNQTIFIQSLKNFFTLWFWGGLGALSIALLFAVILTGKIRGV